MKTKVCTKCGKRKKIEKFWKETQRKSGISNKCNECTSAYKREWSKKHPEKYGYYKHKNRFHIEQQAVYALHKEQINAGKVSHQKRKRQGYWEENRELILKKGREYARQRRYAANSEKARRKAEQLAVYELHKEQIDAGVREARNIYQNKRLYRIRNGTAHKEIIEDRRESRRVTALQKKDEKAKRWEQKLAYWKSDECKETRKERERAAARKLYHLDPRVKIRQNKNRRHAVVILTDGYIRRFLAIGTTLVPTDIPQELVDAKREHIELSRAITVQM